MAPNCGIAEVEVRLDRLGEDAEHLPVEKIEDVGEEQQREDQPSGSARLRAHASSRAAPRAARRPLVLVDPEPDPEHVAAHVGDAVLRLELGVPALRVRACGRRGSAHGRAVERIEQFGRAERGAGDRREQLRLQPRDMPEIRAVVRPFSSSIRWTAMKRYKAEGSKVAPRKRRASLA